MIFRSFYFIFVIILTVESENIALNDIMQNILSEYSNTTTSDKNISPWFFEQAINFLNCGPLPKLNNSGIEYIIKWKKQKIYLKQKCKRYFQTSREKTTDIVCLNGKWIYEDKTCKLTSCPIFYKPAHSFMTNVSYSYNTTVHFSCFSGYSLRGNYSIRCQENQQWSSLPPVCEHTKCLPPHSPKNGSVNNTNEVKFNETISFNCSRPYNLKGKAELTCLQDGEWNFPAPVCTLKCLVPEIAGRVVTISEGTILKPRTLINEGGKVLYSCKRSFLPVTFGIVQCFSGNWYPSIQCRETCKIEEQSGLNFILSRNSSVIEYSCSSGETLLGDSKRTCLENGTWSGKLPMCVKNCQLLPEFGIYSYRNADTLQYLPFGSSVPENTKIVYSCYPDYLKKSIETVTCQNGMLIPEPLCLYRKNIWLNKKDFLMHKNYSSNFVCARGYSCKYFGYMDVGCSEIKCRPYDCVAMHFNNATSEIRFVDYYGSCCVLRCLDF